jgi:ankyrin repeat protein
MKKLQPIFANWHTDVTMSKTLKSLKNIVRKDFVVQGYKPTANNPNGILAEIENYPLAYYDIPTLNRQTFRLKLWEMLLANEDLMYRMRECRSFWGEPMHSDSMEVVLPNVSHKVLDFSIGDNNLIPGTVAITDTPYGNIIYSLAKDGAIGISSRGWGDLIPDEKDSSNQIVSEDSYLHVCWDFVGIPAVPVAMTTLRNDLKQNKIIDNIISYLENQKNKDSEKILSGLKQSDKKYYFINQDKDLLDRVKDLDKSNNIRLIKQTLKNEFKSKETDSFIDSYIYNTYKLPFENIKMKLVAEKLEMEGLKNIVLSATNDMAENESPVRKDKGGIDIGVEGSERDLFYAVKNADVDEIKRLLETGIDINQKAIKDFTPLMIACLKDSYEIVKLLLIKGANPDAQNIYGSTCLHYMVDTGKKQISELLISHGADVNITDKNGRTPLFYSKNIQMVNLLYDKGSELDKIDEFGWTYLIYCINKNFREGIEFCLNQGVNINHKDNFSKTPMIYAVQNDDYQTFKQLVDKGADTEIRDQYDKSVWDYFQIFDEDRMEEYLRKFQRAKKDRVSASRKNIKSVDFSDINPNAVDTGNEMFTREELMDILEPMEEGSGYFLSDAELNSLAIMTHTDVNGKFTDQTITRIEDMCDCVLTQEEGDYKVDFNQKIKSDGAMAVENPGDVESPVRLPLGLRRKKKRIKSMDSYEYDMNKPTPRDNIDPHELTEFSVRNEYVPEMRSFLDAEGISYTESPEDDSSTVFEVSLMNYIDYIADYDIEKEGIKNNLSLEGELVGRVGNFRIFQDENWFNIVDKNNLSGVVSYIDKEIIWHSIDNIGAASLKQIESVIKGASMLTRDQAIKMDMNKSGKIQIIIDFKNGFIEAYGANSGFTYAEPSDSRWIDKHPEYTQVTTGTWEKSSKIKSAKVSTGFNYLGDIADYEIWGNGSGFDITDAEGNIEGVAEVAKGRVIWHTEIIGIDDSSRKQMEVFMINRVEKRLQNRKNIKLVKSGRSTHADDKNKYRHAYRDWEVVSASNESYFDKKPRWDELARDVEVFDDGTVTFKTNKGEWVEMENPDKTVVQNKRIRKLNSDLIKFRSLIKSGVGENKESYKALVFCDVYEDSYEEGEGKNVSSYMEKFSKKSLEALIADIESYVDTKRSDWNFDNINEYGWASELWTDTLRTGENTESSESEMQSWKAGEITLYSYSYHILISKVFEGEVSAEELQSVGISNISQSVKRVRQSMKIKSSEEDEEIEEIETDEDGSKKNKEDKDEETSRKEFSEMVLLEIEEFSDEEDDNDEEVEEDESDNVFDEEGFDSDGGKEDVSNRRRIKSEDEFTDEDFGFTDEDAGLEEETEEDEDEEVDFDIEEGLSVDGETITKVVDGQTITLVFEDGYLTNGTEDIKVFEETDLTEEGSNTVDLYEKFNGDVAEAVNYIIDLQVIDETETVIDMEGSAEPEIEESEEGEDVNQGKKKLKNSRIKSTRYGGKYHDIDTESKDFSLGNLSDAGWYWNSKFDEGTFLLFLFRVINSRISDAEKSEIFNDPEIAQMYQEAKSDPEQLKELVYGITGDNATWHFGYGLAEYFEDYDLSGMYKDIDVALSDMAKSLNVPGDIQGFLAENWDEYGIDLLTSYVEMNCPMVSEDDVNQGYRSIDSDDIDVLCYKAIESLDKDYYSGGIKNVTKDVFNSYIDEYVRKIMPDVEQYELDCSKDRALESYFETNNLY